MKQKTKKTKKTAKKPPLVVSWNGRSAPADSDWREELLLFINGAVAQAIKDAALPPVVASDGRECPIVVGFQVRIGGIRGEACSVPYGGMTARMPPELRNVFRPWQPSPKRKRKPGA